MRTFLLLLLTAVTLTTLVACETLVEEVGDPIDSISEGDLNDPEQIPFTINGVLADWSDAHDSITLLADLLSDQVRFGLNGDATFPTYRRLDLGIPALDNNSVDGAFFALGRYRFLADELVERVQELEFGSDAPITREEALYEGYLHGGIARYYLATYFGLEPRQGGGVIDRSPFIPSDEMYQRSNDLLTEALNRAPGAAEERIVNSILARNYLYNGNYSEAATHAANGMQVEDPSFDVLYSIQSSNGWWNNAGRGRPQAVAADRYRDILADDPAEFARTPVAGVTVGAGFIDIEDPGNIEFTDRSDPAEDEILELGQDKYPNRAAPIRFISWQENHLIRAELELRGENAGDESALELVNEVRDSYGLDALGSVDLATIVDERDRELFVEGARLVDQRRFDDDILPWHLPETVEGQQTWHYLPITQEERNDNPNL